MTYCPRILSEWGDRMKRRVAILSMAVAALWLSACASRPPVPVAEIEHHPRRVAIIPVLAFDDVSIDRSSMWPLLYGGVGFLVERVDMAQKRRVFKDRFEQAQRWIGPELTEALRGAAAQRGFDAIVLDHIERQADDPEDFEYQKIATEADVVVHVRVNRLGLISPTFSNDYVPQIDLAVVIAGHHTGVSLIDEEFSYGVSGRDKFYAVPAPDTYRFSRFDDVLEGGDLVDEGWRFGAKALGRRIIDQLGSPTRG